MIITPPPASVKLLNRQISVTCNFANQFFSEAKITHFNPDADIISRAIDCTVSGINTNLIRTHIDEISANCLKSVSNAYAEFTRLTAKRLDFVYIGDSSNVNSVIFSFTQDDIVNGKLIRTHNLNSPIVDVSIIDNNGVEIMTQHRVLNDNSVESDFSNVVVNGTWKILFEAQFMANTFYDINLRSQSGEVTRLLVDTTLDNSYDFVLPGSTPSLGETIAWDGSKFDWFDLSALGVGTVTSVALTVPGFLSVSGSPINSSGTLAVSLVNQTGNTVFASPANGSSGVPTFRSLVKADLPASTASRFEVSINNAALSAGIYTLSHNLGKKPIIQVVDNTGEIIGIKATHTNDNTASLDFNSVGTLSGTWIIIAIA